MKIARITAVAVSMTVALALAACDRSPNAEENDGSAAASESASASPTSEDDTGETTVDAPMANMTVDKSGGYAGVEEELEVAVDGSWTYQNARMVPEEGELSEEELDSVVAAASDDEITTPGDESDGRCADVFQYQLTIEYEGDVDDLTAQTDECGEAPNEAFAEILELLNDATPI